MASLRCLFQIRASVTALGSKVLPLNQTVSLISPSTNGIHTLLPRAPCSATMDDTFLRASVGRLQASLDGRRWESGPECNHWSKQWERDRRAKKRFSNEGRELRSLFTRRTAAELWKGVTSQSNAAAKSGRGKRGKRMRKIDLNRGQIIGTGSHPMVLPGLNAPLEKRIEYLPEDTEFKDRLVEIQKQNVRPLRKRPHPLERGWTSAKFGGRKIGPPDPIGDRSFDEFESYILEFKRVCHMDGTVGRKFSYSCVVVTGNGKGLAGFAEAKSNSIMKAQIKAKNKAILRLQYVKMYEEHTIFHKIYSKVHASHLFMEPRPAGHGIRATPIHANRVITTICKALGLKDLWVVVEHSLENTLAITKALFRALRAQKDIQQLADEMRLHVVEYRAENDNFPVLIASPRPEVGPVRRDAEIGTQEYRDLDLVLNDGRTTEFRPFGKPSWINFDKNYLEKDRWKMYKDRHQDAAALRRQILYSEDYPSNLVIHFEDEQEEQEEAF